jgi:putative hemolysin
MQFSVANRVGYAFGLQNAPHVEIEDGKYLVRFARTFEEIEAALKLRFEVFNLELGEGLASSFQTGRDRDQFDATCHHLIVLEKETDAVVGTYRLQTIEMVGSAERFYSSGEFDLSCLPREVLAESVELGRACIALEHRNRQVLFLLWKGLALYLVSSRKRFLFGCCSLTSQNKNDGRRMLDYLTTEGHMHPTFFVSPNPGYECDAPEAAFNPGVVKVPRLFDSYLRIGAKVCGPPAIDLLFKTIDFLVILDSQNIEARTRKMFFG